MLCVVYVAQSAGEVERSDAALKSVQKRSTSDDEKRGFRPDLGKRYDPHDDDDELRKSLTLQVADSQRRGRRIFRGDLGKRRSSFRGDLGKRAFRGDLGKRADDDDGLASAEKRPRMSGFRGDLGKRR